jgi:CheY-like chemotaxis protein
MGTSQQPGGGQTCHKRILIVEDDPILGDLLLEALQEETYQVCHVLSGELALNTLQRDVPALLLLDYHLPGMNGLELADWLESQEEFDHISILLMSADVPQEVSCNKHLRTLQKPFELETLLHVVAELLA